MSKEEVVEKFLALTEGLITPGQQTLICKTVDNFEKLDDVGDLNDLMRA